VLRIGVTAGFAPHATSRDFVRVWASAQWRREDFDSLGRTPFPRSTFGAVGAGVDVGHVRFHVLERFNSYARREDVDLSQLLHAEAGALKRPKPGAEFDLWVQRKGPRVFGIHQLTGSRMVWLALEDRILVRDELWSLVGLGVAPFFDYGGAWYPDEPARLGGNAGLALRMGPTRSVHGDVAEFALG